MTPVSEYCFRCLKVTPVTVSGRKTEEAGGVSVVLYTVSCASCAITLRTYTENLFGGKK